MKDTHRFLAFDCGATSGRAVLATFNKGTFNMEEIYRFPNQTLEIGGKLYWNVYNIYEHFLKCLSDLGHKGIQLDSIGIDTWGVDFGCIAQDGSLLGLPRAYRDTYTDGVPQKVFETIPLEELYAITGIQIMNFNTIFQLYAQKQEQFAALNHAKHILFMPDLLSYMLTGKMICEYTDASTSGMMNQQSRNFEKSLLERLGVDASLLLPITQPGTQIGTLQKHIAQTTGLGEVPVIAIAGHDTASAIVAVPAANGQFAYLSSGTWSLMAIETPQPIINEKSAKLNFTNEGGIEGTTRFLKNITGMWLVEQCKKIWTAQGRNYTYPEMVAMAKEAAGYKGRINPDDPRFANPENMEKEIQLALAQKGEPAPKNDAEMLSCIYHSLADRYKDILDMLQDFAPFKIEKLHIIGGGSANNLLNQWTANAIGMPVVAGPVEATAIGNVMMQAKTLGLVSDRWEIRKLIAKTFQVQTFYPEK
ncbi:MAG: rhamnulokinase [Bacteroidales bacterium]|nr:rhamnulokinase [Bacteroidales bacterium]